jgi:hypothetical protein
MAVTAWRTVRVFISSTFRDMQAERDHLVRLRVLGPKLEASHSRSMGGVRARRG